MQEENPFVIFLKLLEETSDPPPPVPEWEMQDEEWRVIYQDEKWIMQDKLDGVVFTIELEENDYTGLGFAKAMAKASEFRTGKDLIKIKENKIITDNEAFIYPNNMVWMLHIPCDKCKGYSLPLPIAVGCHNILACAIGTLEYAKVDKTCMQCRGKELMNNDLDEETYAISWFDPKHRDWMLKVKIDIEKADSVIFSLGVGQLASESDVKEAISSIINI